MSQEQKGGKGSTNIQIGKIETSGLNYVEVREIAKDVLEKNFDRFVMTARDVAAERAEKVREEIIEELQKSPDLKLDGFSQPEKQVALLDAQKAYILTGDEELKKAVVKAVIDISQEPERSFKGIVLQEALKILPTLTNQQLLILATCFTLRYVTFLRVNNPDDLNFEIEKALSNWRNLSSTQGDFRHLAYSKCANIDVTSATMHIIMQQTYPGLWQIGFPAAPGTEAYDALSQIPKGMTECWHKKGDIQAAILNEKIADESKTWTKQQKEILKKHIREGFMNPTQIREALDHMDGPLPFIWDQWENTQLKNTTLTSVGIAIAHSFITKNDEILADLSIWL